MGLYDGAARPGRVRLHRPRRHGCSRRRWCWCVDASSQGRSVAALVHGFAAFDPAVRIGGVILNQVGSRPARGRCCATRSPRLGVPVLGAVRRAAEVAAPSRHLGLVPVAERARRPLALVAALAELVGRTVDLDAVLALARTAPPLTADAVGPGRRGRRPGRRRTARVVAVAGGAAFTFSLRREHRAAHRGRRRRGARSTRCATRRCPPAPRRWSSAAASPRCTPRQLSRQRAAARRGGRARRGGPVVAECAGLLYLGRVAGRAADVRRARPPTPG